MYKGSPTSYTIFTPGAIATGEKGGEVRRRRTRVDSQGWLDGDATFRSVVPKCQIHTITTTICSIHPMIQG